MKTVQERYVYKPMSGSSHWWATKIVNELSSIKSALDVGPGSGIFGQLLKARGVEKLSAIETDAETRERLSDTYNEIYADLSQLSQDSFDLILMLDVLEHMQDPFQFLRQVKDYMNPGGHILISLPNIAHWSTRLQILFGFFEYTDRGILDRTHLQFFNRRRVKKLLQHANIDQYESFNCSIEPAELVLPKLLTNNKAFENFCSLRYQIAQFIPGLLGYQHLVHIKI